MSPDRNDARIAVLLLAAGSSTRMGDNKMTMEIEGETLLRRAAKTAVAAGLDPVTVVTGYERERAEQQVEDLGCDTVFNPDHETGIHTSVRAGIDALPGDVDAVVVMLADMPFVTSNMLAELQRSYRGSDAPLVISRYGGEVKAPPMLYDRSLFSELRVMQRRCGREVVKRHVDEALALEWPIEALADIDTPGGSFPCGKFFPEIFVNIADEFSVQAPADKVWAFFTDPHRVAAALPGARITEQIDDTTFKGSIAVHGGPFSANYEGTFSFDAYEESRQAVVQASGDGSMGSADVRITSQVTPISDTSTKVYVDADVGISGVVAQLAGGIIEQASKKMFKEFGAAVKRALETG